MRTLSFLRERSWRRLAFVLAVIGALVAGSTGITLAATGHHTAGPHALPAASASTLNTVTPSTSVPPSTPAAPATTTPTATGPHTPPAKTSPPRTTAPGKAPSPTTRTQPPTTSLQIKFGPDTVHVDVPVGWHVSTTAMAHGCGCGSDFPPVCILAAGGYNQDPDNCELVVGGSADNQNPDLPNPEGDLPACDTWSTIDDADTSAAGYAADFRTFRSGCTGRISDQWATVTTPQISFWHPTTGNSDDEAVSRAVATARIGGPLRAGRVDDAGYVRNVVHSKDGVQVTIDRVVVDLDGSIINHNPAIYTYDAIVADGASANSVTRCPQAVTACTTDQLIAQFAKGLHPADGTKALDGALIELIPSTGGQFEIEPHRAYAFESSGDHGCTC